MTTHTPGGPNATEVAVGTVLADRYRLDAMVGSGGSATVYRATDESLERTVAIKLFHRAVADAADVRRRDAEIKLVASLSHPCIVTLFDAVADDTDDRAFLVLQYVDGHDLRTELQAGALERSRVAAIAADLADALDHVHARGVLHRDLKPANVLLPEGPGRTTAMLNDFGIAQIVDSDRLTLTGSVLGTAAFLSPEQALGATLTPATDVYSLGLVLIECLTGRRVFPGSGLESASARLSSDPEVPDDVGPGWKALLTSMTARDPGDRPSAAEVGARVDARSNDAEAMPTLVLPALVASSDAETEVLVSSSDVPTERFDPPDRVPAPAPVAPSPLTPRTPRRSGDGRLARIAAIGGALALVAAVIIGLVIWGMSANTPAVDQPITTEAAEAPAQPIEYPVVDGKLGDKLTKLQNEVADLPDPVGAELRQLVLAVAQAAAGDDWTAATAALDEVSSRLTAALDAGEIDGKVGDRIEKAIDAVRTELDKLAIPAEDDGNSGPGNGNGPGGEGPPGQNDD